jgi:hypothetical protein
MATVTNFTDFELFSALTAFFNLQNQKMMVENSVDDLFLSKDSIFEAQWLEKM